MNMKKSILIILILCTISLQQKCKKEDDTKITPQQYKIGIITAGNTAIRIDPIIFSSKVSQIKKGEGVKIIDRSHEKSWIGNTQDYWYKIKMKNGITGWIFGKNIKILSEKNKDELDEFITEFWQEESEKVKKDIAGKWWSVNQFGDFTNHCLEIYEDNKYKSYVKGENPKIIEGEYNFDFNKNEIIFLKGTSFDNNLNLIKRGNEYILKRELEKYELIFKRISVDIHKEAQVKKDDQIK